MEAAVLARCLASATNQVPSDQRGLVFEMVLFRRYGTYGRCVPPVTVGETNMMIDSWLSGADDTFQGVVTKVIDLPEEGLFRSIVSYIFRIGPSRGLGLSPGLAVSLRQRKETTFCLPRI